MTCDEPDWKPTHHDRNQMFNSVRLFQSVKHIRRAWVFDLYSNAVFIDPFSPKNILTFASVPSALICGNVLNNGSVAPYRKVCANTAFARRKPLDSTLERLASRMVKDNRVNNNLGWPCVAVRGLYPDNLVASRWDELLCVFYRCKKG